MYSGLQFVTLLCIIKKVEPRNYVMLLEYGAEPSGFRKFLCELEREQRTSASLSLFPLWKLYAEQLLVLLRTKCMQLRKHADTSKAFQALKGLCDTNIQYKILIVGSARERDFTGRIVWWHYAIAHMLWMSSRPHQVSPTWRTTLDRDYLSQKIVYQPVKSLWKRSKILVKF